MSTVTYGGAVSLDGFLAGADGSIDWLHFSKDVQQVMTDYWKDVDTILMGRKTYAVATAQNRASGGHCQKATGAGPEPVQNSADSQRDRFRKTPILEGFSNFSDEFTGAEPCIQLNLFDF
jgi:hypothetical protein